MSTGYQIKNHRSAYFLTFVVVFWIDLFTRKVYRDILIDSLKYCQKEKGLTIFAWVLMSNHIHLLIRSDIGDLSGTIRDLKKFTSKAIVDCILNNDESRRGWMLRLFVHAAERQNKEGTYQVWTHNNHAEEAYGNSFIQTKIDYIHNNPVRAGIVRNPEDYNYSSAANYAGKEGLLEIIAINRILGRVK